MQLEILVLGKQKSQCLSIICFNSTQQNESTDRKSAIFKLGGFVSPSCRNSYNIHAPMFTLAEASFVQMSIQYASCTL